MVMDFNNKLSNALLLLDGRRPTKPTRLFRGVPSRAALIDGLNHGISPSDIGASYFGSLAMALIYGLMPIWGKKGAGEDDLAHVFEVTLNLNSKSLGRDEDDLPIGEIPYDREKQENIPYSPDSEEWAELFDTFIPEVSRDQRATLAQAMIDYDGEELRRISHNLRPVAGIHDQKPHITGGTHANLVSKQRIGLSGRSRIVGAYVFKNVLDQDGRSRRELECIEKLYDNGGSVGIGQRYERAFEYTG